MNRVLPLFLWIALSGSSLCAYSLDPVSHFSSTTFAPLPPQQSLVITGKVTDENGVGMPGVNILVKGTSNGTTTNAEGSYSLGLSSSEASGTLVFSFIGYVAQEVPINNRSTVDVRMASDIQELSEVVVVGYGVQEKRDVTASIASLSSQDIDKIPSTNPLDGMKGQVAGVDVLQNGGRPGEYPSILIRGRRSINASNDPLFVIDGVPMTAGTGTIYDFNPQDIASMEILKDAAATAIYGSRGANGVVLITTKRGKAGKTTVSYSGRYGITEPFALIPMMNGEEFAAMKREANRRNASNKTGRDAWDGTIPGDDVVFVDPVEYKSATEGRSTDWQDLIYHNGSEMNHQLSIAGGSEKTQFNLSLGYNNQEGNIDGMDYYKITSRLNLDHQLSKKIKVGMSTLFSNSLQNWGSSSVISEAVNQTPLGMPYDDEGKLIFLPISDGIRSNPLNELVEGKRVDERKFNRIFSSIYAQVDIIDGLQYKFLVGPDIRYRTRGTFDGQFTNPRKNGTPAASFENQLDFGYTMENLLTYHKTFNEKHNLGFTFLQSMQGQDYERHRTAVEGLPYETQLWYNLSTAPTVTAKESRLEEWRLASLMGRINYTFNGKYLLQATLRSDGSSRLAEGRKWTNFPGVSVGWRIYDEPFMDNANFLSDLKLRASYGQVGNTSVAPYQTAGRLAGSDYTWDETSALGFRLNEIPNPDLGWEKSATINLGLDYGLFDGRLSGSIEVYKTETTDLLLRRNLPKTSGYLFILSNIGATETRGIEAVINANILDTRGGFKWDADFNISHYKEEIVDLAQRDAQGNKQDDTGNRWFHGHPIRVFFDYEKIGIWQADELDEAQALMKAYPGEIKLRDANGDGTISPDDRVILGTDVPSAYGGLTNTFSFKGIDFSFFLYYRLGFMLDSRFHESQATMQARYNNIRADYWTIDNPSNAYPRPNENQERPQYNTTLRYRDGGFVKLRNVTLGYNFPSSVTGKLGMSALRLYFTAQNAYIWSTYKDFDPENASDVSSGDMPSLRMYSGGINITF